MFLFLLSRLSFFLFIEIFLATRYQYIFLNTYIECQRNENGNVVTLRLKVQIVKGNEIDIAGESYFSQRIYIIYFNMNNFNKNGLKNTFRKVKKSLMQNKVLSSKTKCIQCRTNTRIQYCTLTRCIRNRAELFLSRILFR